MVAETYAVRLFVYDLSRGAATILSQPLIGAHLEGVWHTSISVYGLEYLYGAHGISFTQEFHSGIGVPDEIVALGTTEVPQELFHHYLEVLGQNHFRGEMYQLLRHNCNTFTNEVSQFLTGTKIPEKILRFTEDFENSPMGLFLVPMIEALSSGAIHNRPPSSKTISGTEPRGPAVDAALPASTSSHVVVSTSVQEIKGEDEGKKEPNDEVNPPSKPGGNYQ